MKNLKGSTFEKNIKNYMIRANARGTSRHNTNSHAIHSNAVADKREKYLKDFANYAYEKNLHEESSKLNQHLTDENVTEFLQDRIQNLSINSQHDYVAGFNALVQDLKDKDIAVNVTNSIDIIRESLDNKTSSELHSYINNAHEIINSLTYDNSVIAQLMHEAGFRVSEAIEILNNKDLYLNNNFEIQNVVGKGGQLYDTKEISADLYYRIQEANEVTYYQLLKELELYNVTAHDFRYTYAQDLFYKLQEQGVKYEDALKIVSKELNHHRAEITLLYLQLK